MANEQKYLEFDQFDPMHLCFFVEAHHELTVPKNKHRNFLFGVQAHTRGGTIERRVEERSEIVIVVRGGDLVHDAIETQVMKEIGCVRLLRLA